MERTPTADLSVNWLEFLDMQADAELERRRGTGKRPRTLKRFPIEVLVEGFRVGRWHVKPKKFKEGGRTWWGFEFKRRF